MKKLILITGLFTFNQNIQAQGVLTDVYNAYQTLNGHEEKTIDTSKYDEQQKQEQQKQEEDRQNGNDNRGYIEKKIDDYFDKNINKPVNNDNSDPN